MTLNAPPLQHKKQLGQQTGQAHDGITSEGMTLGRTPMGPGGTSLMSVCFLNSARSLAFLHCQTITRKLTPHIEKNRKGRKGRCDHASVLTPHFAAVRFSFLKSCKVMLHALI